MKIQDATRRLQRLVTIQWVVIAIVAIEVLIFFTAQLVSVLGAR